MSIKTYELDFGGKRLFVELGRLAGQANGSCRVQYGDTTVLITATMSKKPKEADYFPLVVDYEEKFFAAGKIKGSRWIKREGRPSDEAILSARLIDRSIRPRFDQRIRNEIQIVATVLSFDNQNDPDILGLFGASLALMISDVPFDGPVAASRVGRVDNKLLLNPNYDERSKSDFDIVVAGTKERINMIEAGAKITAESEIVEAVNFGFSELKKLIEFQNKIIKDARPQKTPPVLSLPDEELKEKIRKFSHPILEKVLYLKDKKEFKEAVARAKQDTIDYVFQTYKAEADVSQRLKQADLIFEEEIDEIVHKNILGKEQRPDGRKLDELRELSVEVGLLPHSHGSGLFNRGTTQALSILTLGSPGMEQWIETMEIETKKRFMHHYEFPPFSVGEIGRMAGPGRREIGHGALAERALEPILPDKDLFPYTVRVVSQILSSNGSSSMASVCGSSLALMDGGVPIKEHAAGIAMGLMMAKDGKNFKILTDIQGPEDNHGDMDLKVAGTKNGVSAIQMDVKVEGITKEILEKTLKQAKKARLEIIKILEKAISKPRENLSPFAPRIISFKINPEKIRIVIGPGGKMINEIIEQTGVEIDIEDDGSVFITSENEDSAKKAVGWIKNITREVKPGEIFDGKVTRLLDFGAMVEILPNHEGLVHVSEMVDLKRTEKGPREYIKRPSDVLKIGDIITVKVKNIDEYGRINLTMK